MGVDRSFNGEKTAFRNEKYNQGIKIKGMMEKIINKQQRELEDMDTVMSQKMDRLQIFLKEMLADKRSNREKLSDIKEDIIKFKMAKEAIWDRVTLTATTGNRGTWEDQCLVLEEMIAKAQSAAKAEQKKGTYLAEELSNVVMRGLTREEKYES